MIPFVVALLAKLTLILAAGLIVTAVLRSASPSIRHLVMLATIVCCLTLPAAMLISPSWDVGVLPQSPLNLLSSNPGIPTATATQKSPAVPINTEKPAEKSAVAPTASSQPVLTAATDFAVFTQSA